MLPGTIAERRQLVLDLMDHLNFFPKLYENKHAWVIGMIVHQLTDPREQKPLILRRGTRVVAALKHNPALWERVKPFLKSHDYLWDINTCKCGHSKPCHTKTGCKNTTWSNVACKCPGFRKKEL